MNTFKGQSPYNIFLVAFFPISGFGVENSLHGKLAPYKISTKKEWYHGKYFYEILNEFCSYYNPNVKWPRDRIGDLYGTKNFFLRDIKNKDDLIERIIKGDL